jgi:hypothetical protein
MEDAKGKKKKGFSIPPPSITQVLPHLYLGSAVNAADLDLVSSLGLGFVYSLHFSFSLSFLFLTPFSFPRSLSFLFFFLKHWTEEFFQSPYVVSLFYSLFSFPPFSLPPFTISVLC